MHITPETIYAAQIDALRFLARHPNPHVFWYKDLIGRQVENSQSF